MLGATQAVSTGVSRVAAGGAYTAKTVVVDMADNWGDGTYMGLRQIDFISGGSKISLVNYVDYTAVGTSKFSGTYEYDMAFNTSLSKIGSHNNTSWFTSGVTNKRLIMRCYLYADITFDSIEINNYHNNGGSTTRGAKNVKIYTAPADYATTIYGAAIPDSTLIFDGVFPEHPATNTVQDFALTLI